MHETLLLAFFALIAVTAQTIVGFGITFFMLPVLLLFVDPPTAVTILLMMGLITSVLLLIRERSHLELTRAIIWRLILAGIPGFLLGAYTVNHIDKAVLQIIAGLLIVLSVWIQEYMFPKATR